VAHEERVREVRRLLVDFGRDEMEDLLSSPYGLKTFVDMITAERIINGDGAPWVKAAETAFADARGALDADFSDEALARGAKKQNTNSDNALTDDEDFDANDEVVYQDKELFDQSEQK
jgi:hypothetical protein